MVLTNVCAHMYLSSVMQANSKREEFISAGSTHSAAAWLVCLGLHGELLLQMRNWGNFKRFLFIQGVVHLHSPEVCDGQLH